MKSVRFSIAVASCFGWTPVVETTARLPHASNECRNGKFNTQQSNALLFFSVCTQCPRTQHSRNSVVKRKRSVQIIQWIDAMERFNIVIAHQTPPHTIETCTHRKQVRIHLQVINISPKEPKPIHQMQTMSIYIHTHASNVYIFFFHRDAIGTDGRPVNLIAMICILRMLLLFFWPGFDHIESALSCGTSFYFWIIDFFCHWHWWRGKYCLFH